MARPTIYDEPMTVAERQIRYRNLRRANILAEADLAAQHVRAARELAPKRATLHLTDALHALARLEELLRPTGKAK